MPGKGLHNAFGFGFSIPDFNGSIGCTCNHKNLLVAKYDFGEDAFDFPLVEVLQHMELFDFVLFVFGEFLLYW